MVVIQGGEGGCCFAAMLLCHCTTGGGLRAWYFLGLVIGDVCLTSFLCHAAFPIPTTTHDSLRTLSHLKPLSPTSFLARAQETIPDAVVREVFEEAGVRTTVRHPLPNFVPKDGQQGFAFVLVLHLTLPQVHHFDLCE